MRKPNVTSRIFLALALLVSLLVVIDSNAAIKFFSDYPNSIPLDSDLFVLQRNQSYVNSSPLQVRQTWFNNPVFTGTASGVFVGNGAGLTNVPFAGTNATFTFITNFSLFSTNIYVQFITNQTLITTNVTIEVPGGFTNLNLTPKTVMYADVNDAESSIPNAAGVLTNDGSGGIGFSQSLSLSEVDAINFYPTNLFTGLTNAPLLSTDGDGKLTNGYPLAATNVTFIAGANLTFTTNVDGSIVIASSGTITVTTVTNSTFVNTNIFISTSNSFFNLVYITNFYSDIFTNNTFVNTNVVIITGKALVNTLIVTNVAIYGELTNLNIAASSAVITKSDQVLTNAVNAHGVFTNTASGPPSFGLLQSTEIAPGISPNFNAINITNSPYIMGTNNGGGNALVAGSPGTAATMYLTNITADTTLAAATFWNAGGSVIPVYVSCSGGANKQLKFPANFQGAGDLYGVDIVGTGVTITNGEAKWFEIRAIYGVKTNVFASATK